MKGDDKMKQQKIMLNNSDFKTMLVNGRPCIVYKELVPMWNTIDIDLDNYEFYISVYKDEDEGYSEITIICKDGLGDLFAYGMFESVDECKEWLENPYPLY